MFHARPLLFFFFFSRYLLFRGFTQSFRVFHHEVQNDRTKSFDVDKIVAQIIAYVNSFNINALMELWNFLHARFFSHLDSEFAQTVQKLELSLKRYYVVNCIQAGKKEQALLFFERYESHFNSDERLAVSNTGSSTISSDWRAWFSLPFISQPQNDPYFEVFFTKQWVEGFVISLRNFLSLIFTSLPLPKLLTLDAMRRERSEIKVKLDIEKGKSERLKKGSDLVVKECTYLQKSVVDTLDRQQKYVQDFEAAASSGGVESASGGVDGTPPSLEPPPEFMRREASKLQEILRTLTSLSNEVSDHQKIVSMMDPYREREASVSSANGMHMLSAPNEMVSSPPPSPSMGPTSDPPGGVLSPGSDFILEEADDGELKEPVGTLLFLPSFCLFRPSFLLFLPAFFRSLPSSVPSFYFCIPSLVFLLSLLFLPFLFLPSVSSFPPSFLPSLCSFLPYVPSPRSFRPSFLPSFLPSFSGGRQKPVQFTCGSGDGQRGYLSQPEWRKPR